MRIIWNEFTDTWVFGIICGLILGAIVFYPLGIYNGKVSAIKQAVKMTENIKNIKGSADDLIKDFNSLRNSGK